MSLVIVIFCIASLSVMFIFIHRGFPGSAKDIGWKMSGVWSNHKHNLHVLLHNSNEQLRGHVVWSDALEHQRSVEGALVIKGIEIKPFWQWSTGTYVEPISNKERPVRLRLKGNKKLSVQFSPNVKAEEWRLIDPM